MSCWRRFFLCMTAIKTTAAVLYNQSVRVTHSSFDDYYKGISHGRAMYASGVADSTHISCSYADDDAYRPSSPIASDAYVAERALYTLKRASARRKAGI